MALPVRYLDAAALARVLGVDREWIYGHAHRLGAIRLGTGRRRLRFDLKHGTRAFRLRFRAHGGRQELTLHERAGCPCGCGGGWSEPAARTELGNVCARAREGVWERPRPPAEPPGSPQAPTFHEYASAWLQR